MLSKGLAYEKVAKRYLERKGLNIITQNFRSRFGEVDLIMKDKDTIVFIEVRYRSNQSRGNAAETITQSKQQKLIKTANFFLTKKNLWNYPCRFDVISINKHTGTPENDIHWIPAAFYAS